AAGPARPRDAQDHASAAGRGSGLGRIDAGKPPARRTVLRRCDPVSARGQAPAHEAGGGAVRTVLLIRHGAVVGDADRRFIGVTDWPMSEAGEAQIRNLAERLRARFAIRAIYCSDL